MSTDYGVWHVCCTAKFVKFQRHCMWSDGNCSRSFLFFFFLNCRVKTVSQDILEFENPTSICRRGWGALLPKISRCTPSEHQTLSFSSSIMTLCLIGRCGDLSTPSGPIDMNVLVHRILFAGVFWLDPEGMSSKIVSLGLQEVGG